MHIPCGLAGSCKIRTEHPLANPTSLDFPEILSRMLVGLTLTSSSSLTPYIKHFIIRKLYPTMFKSNLPAFLGYHPWEIITLNASPARTAALLQQLYSGFVVVSELNGAPETLMLICIGTYLGQCVIDMHSYSVRRSRRLYKEPKWVAKLRLQHCCCRIDLSPKRANSIVVLIYS